MSTARVRVSAEVKRTLESMKLDPRDTMNDVVERLVEDVRQLDETTLADVAAARADIHAGKYFTQKQLRDALGF